MLSISISFIHSNNIILKEIRPENIYVKKLEFYEIFYLCDFGTSSKYKFEFFDRMQKIQFSEYESIE